MAEYRFANSHISKATLQATASYVVENWTPKTSGYSWNVTSSNLIKPYTRIETGLNAYDYAQGGDKITDWSFAVLTSEMFDYLVNTQFASNLSTPATIETLDQRTGDWEVYQVIATLDYEPITTASNVFLLTSTIKFRKATLL